MKLKASFLGIALVVALVLPALAGAQTAGAPEEHKMGVYNVQQSVEFGVRFTDVSGAQLPCPAGSDGRLSNGNCVSNGMFNTLVNQHSGPRLLEQTFSMHAPKSEGLLFDNLFVTSFGWGGDPNNVARLQVSKEKLYNFNTSFRRDQNAFDYNVLANAYNSPTGLPSMFFTPDSNHQFETRRRMSDTNLTLFPQSWMTIRLGYSRNRYEGPSFSTLHLATDTLLAQNVNTTSDNYNFGFDLKVLPKTKVSYDHFNSWYKGDTSWADTHMLSVLPNGTPADLGLVYVSNSTPCKGIDPTNPNLNISQFTSSKYCNLYTGYSKTDPFRTNSHTDQIALQSNFNKVDFSVRYSYTNTDMTGTLNEVFNGYQQRLNAVKTTQNEPTGGNPIQAGMDAGVTYHLTDKLSLSDTFQWNNWRTQTFGDSRTTQLTLANVLSNGETLYVNLLQDKRKSNNVDLEYDFSRKFGARIGYHFENRLIHTGGTTVDIFNPANNADDDVTTEINKHTAAFGAWLRPFSTFRANADVEIGSADNWEFRTGPRRIMQYRLRASYQPAPWVSMSANGNFLELRNGVSEIQYNAHNRNMGFNVSLNPKDRFGFDLSYLYGNNNSNSFVCFSNTGGLPVGVSGPACTVPVAAFVKTYQLFGSQDHSFDAMARYKFSRLTAMLGYSIARSSGNFTVYNLLQPFGALDSSFHRPVAAVEVALTKTVSAKAAWNYYGYNEQGAAGPPTLPRDFHANSTTLSLKYAF